MYVHTVYVRGFSPLQYLSFGQALGPMTENITQKLIIDNRPLLTKRYLLLTKLTSLSFGWKVG